MIYFYISFIAVMTSLLSLHALPTVCLGALCASAVAAIRPHSLLPLMLGIALALLYAGASHDTLNDSLLPEALWQKPIPIEMDIISVLYDKTRTQSVIVSVVSKDHHPFPKKIKLTRYSDTERMIPGERCTAYVKLKPIHGYFNPGGRDFQATWLARGVTAQGYVVEKMPVSCYPNQHWRTALFEYRSRAYRFIQKHVKDRSIQSLLAALALGDKQLDEHTQIILQKTGTSHLLAISGLHVGLVGLIVYWISRPFGKVCTILKIHASSRAIGMIISLAAVFVYILVTGCAVSSQRAGWMYALGAYIFIRQQSPVKLHLLLVVMGLMICLNAYVVLDLGFWLSSSMVFILIILCSYTVGSQKGVKKSILLQLHLSIVAFPLTLLLLKQTSLISAFANVIAIPVVSLAVVPLLLLFDCLLPFSEDLAAIVLKLAAVVMEWLWWFLSQAEPLPVMFEKTVSGPRLAGCLVLASLLFMMPRGLWARALGVYFLWLLWIDVPKHPGPSEVWVTWVDVGQGLSTVIQTEHHVLVYDTGPEYDDLEVANLTLIPFLKHSGIHTIDQLIISHADNDHRGSIPRVLQLFHVKEMVVGQELPDVSRTQMSCHQDKSWEWDGVLFEQWHVRGHWVSPNNHSCVLKVTAGNQSVLLTGDLEREGEWALLRDHLADLTSTVMSVPHHGSNTSSTEAFLEAVRPSYAVISAGFLNSYHHPHHKVMGRYDALGVKSLNTGQVGSIRVTLTGRIDIGITCYRDIKC